MNDYDEVPLEDDELPIEVDDLILRRVESADAADLVKKLGFRGTNSNTASSHQQ